MMELTVTSAAKLPQKSTPSVSSLPMTQEQALAWMGPPPLVPGESPTHYQHVLTLVAEAIKPVDIIDWFWVRDITDLEWEVVRLRKIKAYMITREKATKFTTDEYNELTVADGSHDENLAFALKSKGDILERIGRMINSLEIRRDRILSEYERRRSGSAARLRRVAEQIEDAEFREIAPDIPAHKQAA
jgi:hypothetical protein